MINDHTHRFWPEGGVKTKRQSITFAVIGESRDQLFEKPEKHTPASYCKKYGHRGLSSPQAVRNKWHRLTRPAEVTNDMLLTEGQRYKSAITFDLILLDGSIQCDCSIAVLNDIIVGIRGTVGMRGDKITMTSQIMGLRYRYHALGDPETVELKSFLVDTEQFREILKVPGKSVKKKKRAQADGDGDLCHLSNTHNTGAARDKDADYWDSLNPHGITSNRGVGARIVF